jgi:hypothetical protein
MVRDNNLFYVGPYSRKFRRFSWGEIPPDHHPIVGNALKTGDYSVITLWNNLDSAMSRLLLQKLCETDRFRRFVCDLCIDRGQKQISGLRTFQNRGRTPARREIP